MRLNGKILIVSALIILLGAGTAQCASRSTGSSDPMKRLSTVYDMVRREYVREMSNEELMDGAIKGMLQSLDPHSTYLTKSEYDEMQETTSGKC